MEKILIIEDDEDIAELERDYLEAAGFQAEILGNGQEGEKRALDPEIALVLLIIAVIVNVIARLLTRRVSIHRV